MLSFTVNEFISLKIEKTATEIYLNGKYFNHCKYLLITIPEDRIEDWDGYDSIDEIIAATGDTEANTKAHEISPETEFWGHCSNIQAWVENNYNYKILDTKLSIPIITEILKNLLGVRDEKEKFRRFFMEVVATLDDYIINSLNNEATHDKFSFLIKTVCSVKQKYFSDEEISDSILLKEIYDRNIDGYLEKLEKTRHINQFKRWEAKIWGTGPENLRYRYHLRYIRDFNESSDQHLLNSDEIGYLPYLYATGRFTKMGSISMCYLRDSNDLIIRDENGKYWKNTENHDRGMDYGYGMY